MTTAGAGFPTAARCAVAPGVWAAVLGAVLLPLAALGHAGLEAPWSPADVWAAVAGGESPFGPLIREVRLPRTAAACLAGAMLALSGVVFQALTGNVLAAPGVLGVTTGANVGLVAALLLWPGAALVPALPAFLGGLAAAAITAGVARAAGGGPTQLILAGIAVSLAGTALSTALALFDTERVAGVFVWSAGDVAQGSWHAVAVAAAALAPLGLGLAALARSLDRMRLGATEAAALGVAVTPVRLGAGALAVLMAALAVSMVGPIAFLGLVVPNALRALGIARPAALAPPAAAWGALLLLGADAVSLALDAGATFSAGLVTALIGAPVLVALVARRAPAEGRGTGLPGRRRSPPPVAIAAGAVGVPLLLAASVATGATGPPALDSVLAAVGALDAGQVPAHVLDQRLPRTTVALLAGAFLALAGVLLQGVVRNPLAGPEVLGLTQGAGLAVVAAVLLLPGTGREALQLAAVAGAAAALIVVTLAAGRASAPVRLALVGVAISGVAASLAAVAVHAAGLRGAEVLTWLAGSTYARGWPAVASALPGLALWLPAALLARRLDVLRLGDAHAGALGMRAGTTRRTALATAALAAGAAVAIVGPVAFVGLVAPHAARLLVGGRHGPLLAVAPLLGGGLLAVADLVGRSVLAPTEVPAGVVTALLGAPYFLGLLALGGRRA
ncbi:iron complex transport system permease protein [Limimonas halophila]|uniref:Iron complex transport system permease protein n=1 Tax=Limimonas halophila TaxID=1082479 RepID=A0A1G7PRP6_9PROT|nr:iron chelate uptake ABC transporter family permease subunit [Limimonas halophila]SDF88891.1 iron complex transport system permease protein [Limimonas halophila]